MASKKKARAKPPKKKPVRRSPRTLRLAKVTEWFLGDKLLAVAHAIQEQLTSDWKWPPNDGEKIMGQDYNYANDAMGRFLNDVQRRLRDNTPPHQFAFESGFATASLAYSVNRLTGEVDLRTT